MKVKTIFFFLLGLIIIIFLAACGNQAGFDNPEVSKKVQASLSRSNDSPSIDKEFESRFAMKKEAAKKLVTKDENGQIWVKHKFGTTKMPENHKRIVVIRMEDPMLALGIPMVAAANSPNYYLHDSLAEAGLMNISVNDESKTINLEQVQAAKPDLIVMRDSFSQSVYDNLSKIAPTVAFDLRKEEVATFALALALHQEARGDQRMAQFYDTAKAYRIGIHKQIGDSTVAFLRIMNKEVRLYPYSTNDINRFMYELLNLQAPSMVLAGDNNGTNTHAISLERLPDLKADYLLVSVGYGPTSKEGTKLALKKYEDLQKDALWSMIPAVKHNQVIQVDSRVWNAHGIIAKELAMKEIYDAWGNR